MGQMLCFVTAGMIGLAPGSLLCSVLNDLPLEVRSAVFLVGGVVFFPVLLLSELERGSPIELLSPKLWGSLVTRPGHWLLFYAQTALICLACAGVVAGLAVLSLPLALLAVPVLVVGSFLYFCLLGRLA